LIRINLFPSKRGRVSKKAIDFRNYLMLVGSATAVVVLGGGLLTWAMASRIHSLQAEKQQVQAQLVDLKAKSAQIATFEDDRKTFEEKIKIIAQLKTRQGRPVQFLDTMAHRIPDRVWLTRLEEKGGTVTVVGRALTNADIVDMIRSMKDQAFLSDVQLVESRQVQSKDLSAYEFTLTGKLPALAGDAQAAAPGGAPAQKRSR
jgi:type IV pilus assembly protein PilN